MSVFNNLIQIARTHKARLVGTFSLVLAENLLLVTYPVLGGFAINGVLEGNLWKALGYAGVVLVMWTVGSARRAVDTRTFTRIYAEMVVPVILRQRADGERVSTISARAALSRELVDFFEQHLPTLLTSTITVLGAVVMLLIIEFWSGVTSLVILLVFMGVVPRYSRVNDRLERDVHVIEHYDSRLLTKHYGLLSRLRVKISNREAISYAVIGVTLAILFGITLGMLTLRGHADAGHLYAVVSYLWSFAMSIDDAPHLLEEFSKIRDISERVRVED